MARKSAIKAYARQYLRPGNHTRSKNLCTVEGCSHRPINRVYFEGTAFSRSVQLLCPVHVIPHLGARADYQHINKINKRYRANLDFPYYYNAD